MINKEAAYKKISELIERFEEEFKYFSNFVSIKNRKEVYLKINYLQLKKFLFEFLDFLLNIVLIKRELNINITLLI